MAKRGKTDREEFKLTTPEFRGSFVNLLKPRSYGDGEPKYTMTIVLESDDPFWDKLQRKIDEVAKKKFGSIPSGLLDPIQSGKRMKLEEFKGMDFCRAGSTEKPGVVGMDGSTLIDRGDVYSGAWYRAVIKPYAWEHKATKRKGVSIQLDNVLKVRDDDPFSGRASAAEDFKEYVDEEGGEEEDDRPRRRSSRDRDEEEERPRRSGRDRGEEQEDDRPRRRPTRDRDEDDDRPRRRSSLD